MRVRLGDRDELCFLGHLRRMKMFCWRRIVLLISDASQLDTNGRDDDDGCDGKQTGAW
jgi:hypothetical protein